MARCVDLLEEGEDELVNRRIGANERSAIKVLRAYLDAQKDYAERDRNGDGVLQYAQRLGSTPGKHDGLYWPADAAKGEEASPLGPLAQAEGRRWRSARARMPAVSAALRGPSCTSRPSAPSATARA